MRSIVAVLAGGVLAAVIFQVGAAVAFVILHGIPLGSSPGRSTVGYFVLNLGFSGIAAMAGGRLTARLTRQRRRTTVSTLALLLAAVALWGFSQPASQWPAWYPPLLALVGLVGVLVGGLYPRGAE